jgi:RNA polymerase sigma-70 factor (ECF subfamily)
VTDAAAAAERSDAELIAAARAGEAPALEALLERHQPRIYRFSMKMCRRPEDAQDVLQDTLLAMARSLRDFRGAASVSTWLYTIARSFCIKKRRRSKFAPSAELSLENEAEGSAAAVPDPGRAPDEAAAGREIGALLQRAIASLDSHQREVLVLRDVEGLPAAEVAEVLGLGVEAVKSRLHRARAALRERLAPALGVLLPKRGAAYVGCPDVVELFSRHLEGQLSASACTEMESHLKRCGWCFANCEALKRTLGACKAVAVSAPVVPADLQDQIRAGIRALLAEQR